ncbi:AAA family ATPase [Paraglaciecola aquimarina]|uniref:AAA family ATPase n=1 Tax=Paraglaciecola aquimarina TaxID=1235557 RepID=A0ABU3SRZ5_9ALTE|nr:AAA family ATPase [Paraglaciecola aquimarina]MDU0352764.1 AAA family ATPase [Paraglaciecola aquimarina]
MSRPNKLMTRGLTLGKFAPLHIGHQFLIDFALQHVDELVIVIYACDELPVCPLETRIDWINQLYPNVKVIAAKDGPKEVGYSQAITNKHDAYLKHLLQDYTFDCFFSSEPYGEHVSLALNCRDTNAFTTWHFALHYHQKALPELERLAKQCWQRYDLVVLCEDDIPYDNTWERSGDANRQVFQQFNRDYLAEHNIPHISVTGSLSKRAAQVTQSMLSHQ